MAEAIADLERRLGDMVVAKFLTDRDEQALTAFRLSIVGENANKLSDGLKARHPELPWSAMYAFRNVVSHEYHMISPDRAWDAVESLSRIREMVEVEMARLEQRRDRDSGRDR